LTIVTNHVQSRTWYSYYLKFPYHTWFLEGKSMLDMCLKPEVRSVEILKLRVQRILKTILLIIVMGIKAHNNPKVTYF